MLTASATVTVMIDDINDHVPVFTQSIYRAVMSESYGVGASIISISATDADTGSNARLLYSLREQDREFFTVVSVKATNTGVLKVYRVSSTYTVTATNNDGHRIDYGLGGAAVGRRTRNRKVAGSTFGHGAIKSTRSTQPSIPPG